MKPNKKRKYWNEEEKELLKKLYEGDGLSAEEIGLLLDRTKEAIEIKASRWGFRRTEEQEFLNRSRAHAGDKNAMWGKEAWSKGKTKETDETLANASKAQSTTRKRMFKEGLLPDNSGDKNPMWGKSSWNNGLTSETDERVAQGGRKASATIKKKWNEKPEEEKNILREHCAKIGIQNKALTSIELKVQKMLNELGIEFEHSFHFQFYTCDILILNSKLIIECQGDYWHANPKFYSLDKINKTQLKNVNRDKRKYSFIANRGFEILYLWENDIHKSYDETKEKIRLFVLNKINKIQDAA